MYSKTISHFVYHANLLFVKQLSNSIGGDQCCVIGCGSYNASHKGLSFHKIPTKGKSATKGDKKCWSLLVGMTRDAIPTLLVFVLGTLKIRASIYVVYFRNLNYSVHDDNLLHEYLLAENFETLTRFSLPTKLTSQNHVPLAEVVHNNQTSCTTLPVVTDTILYHNIEELNKP